MERRWPPALPSPQEQRTGAQALPGIGHGPLWPSRVTGKCPSSAGLQAVQTMLGCPGVLPPKSKRGWETAPREPFIPGAGLAHTAWPCAGCQGRQPLEALRCLVRALVQDTLQGLRGEGEGAPPHTPGRLPGPSGMSEPSPSLGPSAQDTCRPQLLTDPLWRRPCSAGKEAGGGVCRRGIATLSLSKGNFPRNQEVTGATLASSR